MDLTSVPVRTTPASNFSSKKYTCDAHLLSAACRSPEAVGSRRGDFSGLALVWCVDWRAMGLRSSYLSASFGFRLWPLGFRFANLKIRDSSGVSEAGSRMPGTGSRPYPLGLRPKSITAVCTSTSGAGNGDAIIASQKAFSMYRVDFPRENTVGTRRTLGTLLVQRRRNKEDYLVRIIE